MRLSNTARGLIALAALMPLGALAGTYNLTIDHQPMTIDGKAKTAMTINGGIPGPTLHFQEGEEVTIKSLMSTALSTGTACCCPTQKMAYRVSVSTA